jgi:hypothetical protein
MTCVLLLRTVGAEASLYIVLLHLGYYLKNAPLAPEPGQLAPRFSAPMSPVEVGDH